MKSVPNFRFILLALAWGVMLAAWPHPAASQPAGGSPTPPFPAKSAMDLFISGGAQLDKGNLDQAIADYTGAIEQKPDFFAAYLNRGTAERKKGKIDLAIADYNKAIELKADFYEAYTLRGICYGKKGKYEEAVADLTKALEKKPHYLTYLGLAWIFATSKIDKYRNGTRAVELAEKAVLLHKTADSLHTLAAAYAETAKFKEAAATQAEALNLLKTQSPPPQEDLSRYGQQLQAYQGNKPWRE
ncbi:MAG: tetratricopeptide repeat protein [Desulfobaccales bacterium]